MGWQRVRLHTFMTESSEALSKGLPLKVVISLGILTCCFRLGTTNLEWGGVAEKARVGLVGCTRERGVLKTAGLRLCSEEVLARSSRDTHCIHLRSLSLQRAAISPMSV